jgi:hypothetical protein
MWFRSTFDSLKRGISRPPPLQARHGAARRRPAARQLQLEALEDRYLLSFSPAVNYPVGASPQAVVTGDFNGDGRLDLAVANGAGSTVSILLGNADGTFQTAQNFATGVGPQSIAVGDFNGDGKLDIVTANANDVSVLLGNGNGTFQAPRSIALPGEFPPGYTGPTALPQAPSSVAVGDLNGDGKLDLVVRGQTTFTVLTGTGYYGNYYATYRDGYVNVLLGNGDASFTPKAAYHLDNGDGSALALGNFNGDGKLDVVAVSTSGGGVNVLPGNGDGTLQAPIHSASGVPFGGNSVATGDFNGDGKLDLVTRSFDGNGVLVQKGNGDGTFQAPQFVAVGSTVQSVVVGDVNSDGKLDITALTSATAYSSCGYYACYDPVTTGYANVLLGYGDGLLAPPLTSNLGSHFGFSDFPAVAMGDFNGDGRSDLAAPDSDQGTVAVTLNAGGWVAPMHASSFAVSGFPSSTTAGAAGTFTVTARKADGTTATGYIGIVHFSSSDAQAGLPADYTFTPADAGVHTFSATLKTAGTQSLTAMDTGTASATGSQTGIIVHPAAAITLGVAGFPSAITAGVPGTFTVTARDAYGNTASGYTGTVSLTSSDPQRVVPGPYTFTAADAGQHTFTATLKTAGSQSLTATDTTTASITGTQAGITVNPAAATHLVITGPSSIKTGKAFSITVTAVDAYGNIATGYTGTVHFQSTDRRAVLPQNYTFTAADNGVHIFSGLKLRTRGTQAITVFDTLNAGITGSLIVNVL